MQVLQINSLGESLRELVEGKTGRQARIVGCDVAGSKWTKLRSAAEITCSVDLLHLTHKRISSGGVARIGVAVVATPDGVYQVAAPSDQEGIFANQIQGHRRYVVSNLNIVKRQARELIVPFRGTADPDQAGRKRQQRTDSETSFHISS
jgi:hypothetical protein